MELTILYGSVLGTLWSQYLKNYTIRVSDLRRLQPVVGLQPHRGILSNWCLYNLCRASNRSHHSHLAGPWWYWKTHWESLHRSGRAELHWCGGPQIRHVLRPPLLRCLWWTLPCIILPSQYLPVCPRESKINGAKSTLWGRSCQQYTCLRRHATTQSKRKLTGTVNFMRRLCHCSIGSCMFIQNWVTGKGFGRHAMDDKLQSKEPKGRQQVGPWRSATGSWRAHNC